MDKLPTSFRLEPEEVDKLQDAARQLLRKSKGFQKLLRDLEKGSSTALAVFLGVADSALWKPVGRLTK